MTDSSAAAAPDLGTNGADYVVVARRYRPQTFEDLIGQQHVSQALSRAIESERVGHAYLFTGARGVGKTSAARILAKALNCARGASPTPCNECEICESVSTGDDVDVIEIDGASNNGVDNIRQLRQNVSVRPSRARYKIYIIDEVHMVTTAAFNALLKTLEEPPEHVKFIFATTEPNKIPVTILSRCQRYDFAGIEAAAIQARLEQIATAEGVTVEADALQILAMRAAGSMRDSQSLLEQLLSTGTNRIAASDVTSMLGIAPATRLSQLVQPLVNRDAATALAELDAGVTEGAEVSQLLDQLLGYFRDVMTQSVGCDASSLLYSLPSQQQEVQEVAKQLGVQTLLAIVQVLDQTAARMRVSTHTRTLAEMAIVRICHLENLDELSALIPQLRAGIVPTASSSPAPSVKKNITPKPAAPATTTPAAVIPTPSAVPPPAAPAATKPTPPEPAVAKPVAAAPVAATPAAPTSAAIAPAVSKPVAEPTASATATAVESGTATAPTNDSPADADTEAEEGVATPLNADNVEEVWKKVLNSLDGMVMDLAAEADKLSVDASGKLLISFGKSFHRDACEKPANRVRIEQALHKVCGSRVGFLLGTHKRADAPTKSAVRPPTRRQQQVEISTHPFVKRAMELFDGDPNRLRYVPPKDK